MPGPVGRGWWGGAGAHLQAGGPVQVEQVHEDSLQPAAEVAAQAGQQPQQCLQHVHTVRPGGLTQQVREQRGQALHRAHLRVCLRGQMLRPGPQPPQPLLPRHPRLPQTSRVKMGSSLLNQFWMTKERRNLGRCP